MLYGIQESAVSQGASDLIRYSERVSIGAAIYLLVDPVVG